MLIYILFFYFFLFYRFYGLCLRELSILEQYFFLVLMFYIYIVIELIFREISRKTKESESERLVCAIVLGNN